MGKAVKTHLDEDLYDEVLDIHTTTGKSKSQIVNEMCREASRQDGESLADTVLPVFGQSLFIVGFIVAFYSLFVTGIAVSMVGLTVMISAKADEYRQRHDVGHVIAIRRVLGI